MNNKSKRRHRIFALIACVCLVCSMFVVSSHAEDTITDLSGTTWIWNDIPPKLPLFSSSPAGSSFSFNFTSDVYGSERVYDSIYYTGYGNGSSAYSTLSYGFFDGSSRLANMAVESGGLSWANQGYRTIHIIDGTDVTNATFIAYLQANATLIPPDPTQDLMSDVGDVLSEILTDVGDVANSIVSNPVLLVMCIGLPIISVVCGFLARFKNRT